MGIFFKKFLLITILYLAPGLLSAQVVIYTDCYNKGLYSSLGPGNYYNAFQFRLPDNSVSSIKIPRGFRVELYDNFNLIGTPVVLTGSVSCFSASLTNRVSSIRVTYNNDDPWGETNQDGGSNMFTECDYHGRNFFLPPGNYPRLRDVIGTNLISSFKVPRGMVVELFIGDDFTGTSSGKVTSDINCLGTVFNNRVASARIYYQDNGGWVPPVPPIGNLEGKIVLYNGCNYWGNAVSLQTGSFADIRTILSNGTLGSMQVSPGLTIELYSGLYFTGSVLGRYNSNQSCLPSEIQYRALSARVTSGDYGGNWEGKGVSIFSDCYFGGRSKNLVPGRYNDLNVASIGINPASIRVAAGYEIVLYAERNFQGISAGRITENENCLGDYWIGRARSAVVTYVGGSGGGNYEEVVLYRDCNFRGTSQSIAPGYYNNIYAYGGPISVNPSSLRIPPGYKVELFQQLNYTGTRIVLNSNNSCISSSWRGKVKSMIVTYNDYGGGNPWAPGGNEVELFSSCYYSGPSKNLGEGIYPDIRSITGSSYVNISSLKVPHGYVVELYSQPGYRGTKTTIQADMNCLVSSIRGKVGSMAIRRR